MTEPNQSNHEALVIIPTYNECANIQEVIARVFKQPASLDILVIDDNSPDGTGDIVAEYSQKEPRLRLIRREGKLGLGTAYIRGFEYALLNGYKYIFEMDADLSHDPNEIPNFLKAAADAHVVIGSRYIKGVNVVNWPLSRLLLSYFASIYARVITGLPVRDTTSGFKCFRREALEAIDFKQVKAGGYAFQIEMSWRIWNNGFKLKEIPITFVDRTVGKSKMSKAIVREAVIVVWKLGFLGILKRWKLRRSGGWQPLS
jgi:dolichol-phosphate mannosyltransferase